VDLYVNTLPAGIPTAGETWGCLMLYLMKTLARMMILVRDKLVVMLLTIKQLYLTVYTAAYYNSSGGF
jgi:hypothetical protein